MKRKFAIASAGAAAAVALGVFVLVACGGGGGEAGRETPPPQPPPPPPVTLGAAQLAVLYANGDATSEAVARAYQAARGVPEAQVIGVDVATGSDSIAAADFGTLKTALDGRLGANVQATLVTWMRPSRVRGSDCSMSLTSALAFGYDAARCSAACGTTQPSSYYRSTSNRPFSDLGIRPSMMLGASTLAEAQALINRGVAADGSFSRYGASGHAWLVRTSDPDRAVRWPDLMLLAGLIYPGLTMHYVDNSSGSVSNLVTDQNDVMFMFTGLHTLSRLESNRWLPGAIGDTLTSSAGRLGDHGGQTPVTAWLQAGATASYGTVEEPCNYLEKFPRATVLVERYREGDALIEAYWKSVQRPGQGLFVGEPLARPWAR